MPVTINGSGGLTFADGSVQTTVGYSPWRNRIINGDMRIDQRNNGASMTAASTAAYCMDRWQAGVVGANGTMQRVSTGRTDFPFALRLTGTASSTIAWCSHKIESVNAADLVGQSVTVCFYIAASSLTGVSINLAYANAADNFGSVTNIGTQNRTINSTLTQYTATFTNLPSQAANGLYLEFVFNGLGASNFTITGVQLEAGSTVTPFERVDYSEMLRRCERYLEFCMGASYIPSISSGAFFGSGVNFRVSKRTSPTVTRVSDAVTTTNVNAPYAEAVTAQGFRAIAQANATGTSQFATTYRAECEL